MSSRQRQGHRLADRMPPGTPVRVGARLAGAVVAAAALVAAVQAVVLAVVLEVAGPGPGSRVLLAEVLLAGAVLVGPLALAFGGWRLARSHAEALHDLAVDDVTGTWSRRAFGTDLPAAVLDAAAASRPLTLALVELTGVPTAVELFGRRRTEALVRVAAGTLAGDEGAATYRLAGEMFAVVLPAVGPDAAFELVDAAIERLARPAAPLSAVAGLCTLDARCPDAQLLLVGASAALDEARSLGAGRVVASADEESGLRWVATAGGSDG